MQVVNLSLEVSPKELFAGLKILALLLVVEFLIQNGADVNQKDYNGRNAMMCANDAETREVIIKAVKKRNVKTCENVIVQGIERE